MRNRAIIAVASAVFLVLAGTGTSSALWSSQTTASATVSSGTHSFSQNSFANAAAAFSSSTLSDTASVQIQNTGSITAPFSMTITAPTGPVATAVLVRMWPTTGVCTTATTVPSGATSGNWTNVPAITGTLAGGAGAFHCIRTSITASQAASVTGSMTATMTLSSAVGSWTTSTTATAVQTIGDTTAPTAPGTPTASGTTASSTTITWAASTDAVGVTGYRVFRDGVLVESPATRTFTDTALTGGRTYTYTIQAVDAAGNVSATSGATSVTTPIADPSRWYTVVTSANTCLDGYNDGTTARRLNTFMCDQTFTQDWKLVPIDDTEFFEITSRAADATNPAGFAWQVGASAVANDTPVFSRVTTRQLHQQWRITARGDGTVGFINRSSGNCLDSYMDGRIVQYMCDGTVTQNFRLVASADQSG